MRRIRGRIGLHARASAIDSRKLAAREYTRDALLNVTATRAIDTARIALLGAGFEILRMTETELVATSAGMNSTQQPALLGATEVTVCVLAGQLRLRAVLGGVRRMQLFVLLFPPSLLLFLAITLGLLHGPRVLGPIALAVASWLVMGPLPARWLRLRTEAALDGLFRSMLACG